MTSQHILISFLFVFGTCCNKVELSSSFIEHQDVVFSDFLEVGIVMQGNQTKRQQLHFTSSQSPDRVAAAFCFRHRCQEAQTTQIEKLIDNIQKSYNISSEGRSMWLINYTHSYLPVFLHHDEGFTEFHILELKSDAELQGTEDANRKAVKIFCKTYNCSKLAGYSLVHWLDCRVFELLLAKATCFRVLKQARCPVGTCSESSTGPCSPQRQKSPCQ